MPRISQYDKMQTVCKKKSVFQINSVLGFGSTGRIADNIGNTAIDYGWQSYIAYGRGGGLGILLILELGHT